MKKLLLKLNEVVKWLPYILLFVTRTTLAQDIVAVSFDKATVLNFPSKVRDKGVVVGNEESLEATPKGKMVFLRPMEEGIPETNLVVELEDGSVYEFGIVYKVNQKSFVNVDKEPNVRPTVMVASNVLKADVALEPKAKGEERWLNKEDKKELVTGTGKGKEVAPVNEGGNNSFSEEEIVGKVTQAANYISGIGVVGYKMQVWIGGIWFFNGNTYLKLNFLNNGKLPYTVMRVGLNIQKVGHGGGGSVDQTNRLDDAKVFNLGDSVGYKGRMTVVIAVQKLSISQKSQLVLLVHEKGGNRTFKVVLDYKDLLEPKTEF